MPLILGANSVSGYTVKNSLRFNSASSDYLSRTPSSTGDRQKFTISCWVKRSTLTASGKNIMVAWSGAKAGASFGSAIYFNSSDQIEVDHDIAGSDYTFNTNMVFRDVSAWYHIVLAVDTTQATSANRQTIYVNGSSVALTATALGFPIQNFNTFFNFSGGENDIGSDYFTAGYADQYMSEFYLIDGQALTPSSFGETDTLTGIWIPKAYTGTFGTNGFYLQFKNSASLGTDSSGNGNTFTVNNLTSIDQTTDTPTNNFATLNSLDRSSTAPSTILSEGNTVAEYGTTASVSGNVWGTIGVNTGKWYAEFNLSTYLGSSTLRCGFVKFTNTSGATKDVSATGIYMVALDLINSLYWVGTNGVWDAGDPSAGTGGTSLTPSEDFYTIAVRDNSGTVGNGGTWKLNTGNPAFTIVSGNTDAGGFGNFEYAVPSGYYALCTKNLANFG